MSIAALLELASRETLYHATNSMSALYVLKSGVFKMPLAETNSSETLHSYVGKDGTRKTEERHIPGLFYLSTARSLSSGYIADRSKTLRKVGETTVFVLDWPTIQRRNRGATIQAIDYWGMDETGRKFGSGREQEERIYSNNRDLKVKGAIKEILMYVDSNVNFRMRQVYAFCLKNRIPIKLFTEANFQGFLRRKEKDEDRKEAISRLQSVKQDRYMSGMPGKTPSSSKTAAKFWNKNLPRKDRRLKELDVLTVLVNANDYGKLPKQVQQYFWNISTLRERFTSFLHNLRGESAQGSDSTDKLAKLLKQTKSKSVSEFFKKLDVKWEALREKYNAEEREKYIKETASSSFSMPFAELIMDPISVKMTLADIAKGKLSKSTDKPISVYLGDAGFHLGDGYHRVVEAILKGKKRLKAVKDNRFVTSFNGKHTWTPDFKSSNFGFDSLVSKETIDKAKKQVNGK